MTIGGGRVVGNPPIRHELLTPLGIYFALTILMSALQCTSLTAAPSVTALHCSSKRDFAVCLHQSEVDRARILSTALLGFISSNTRSQASNFEHAR